MDEEEKPEWLGESLYDELKNPKSLQGTFGTYLRLVEDMDYAKVLSTTGSMTIFPANDEAFATFFANGNNQFGKSNYEELTTSEKAQLFYASAIDNAIVSGNLSTNSSMQQGRVIKHPSKISLVQSVTPLYSQNMPANNKYFNYWKNNGKSFNALYDDTNSPIVHFTGEYFLNNNMTVAGEESDFYILTGQNYQDGDVYVFGNKVLSNLSTGETGNVVCQNGYIHQVDKVLLNPGNMAQMLRNNHDTRLISRMLDYFAVPVAMNDKFNREYREYAAAFGTQDSVYAIRYLSKNSQKKIFKQPSIKDTPVNDDNLLSFDPGWNSFCPTTSADASSESDIAAILAPTDNVVKDYFSKAGAYIVKNLGDPKLPTDQAGIKANIEGHIDAIYNHKPSVIASILNNIMKPYLSKTVPSSFSTVQNDAFEFLNVKKEDINRVNGKYDVQIANNGVIYKMNKFFAPELYNSVLGPASVYTDMRIMGNMLRDCQVTPGTESTLGADMYYYLLSMKSKYALFIPTDNEDFYYIDPASKYDTDGMKALKFVYRPDLKKSQFDIYIERYFYDKATNTYTIDNSVNLIPIDQVQGDKPKNYNTQIQDMLNYHTVVLDPESSGLNGNHYYMTKHGGAVYVPDGKGTNLNNSTVRGGMQIGTKALAPSVVTELFAENSEDASIKNGTVYRLSRPVQPTIRSVFETLEEMGEDYKEFFEFCQNFGGRDELYHFVGILKETDKTTTVAEKKKQWEVFGNNNIVNFLGAYNYTIYAPKDMTEAYNHGLPSWKEVEDLYNKTVNDAPASDASQAEKDAYAKVEEQAKKDLYNMLVKMREFIRYHVQNNSVFVDNTIPSTTFQTFKTNNLGIAQTLKVTKSGSSAIVEDAVKSGRGFTPKVADANFLARDIVVAANKSGVDIDGKPVNNNKIESSSFVVVQGIDKPLCYSETYGPNAY